MKKEIVKDAAVGLKPPSAVPKNDSDDEIFYNEDADILNAINKAQDDIDEAAVDAFSEEEKEITIPINSSKQEDAPAAQI